MERHLNAILTIAICIACPITALAQTVPPPSAGLPQTKAADAIDQAAGQIGQETAGNYGKLDRPTLDPLGIIQRAWDRAKPDAGQYTVPFGTTGTAKIRIRVGMPVTIVLPEGEVIPKDGLVIGYGVVREVTRHHNKIVLEAVHPGADTSITILGASGRTYVLYARTENYASSAIPDLLVTYPGPPVTPLIPPGGIDPGSLPDLGNPKTLQRLSFEYTMAGNPEIAPDIVFSDGIWTYLRWSTARWKSTDLPQVYRVVDGVDEPVEPPEVVGTTLVVKETGPLSLRSGQRYVCIRPTGPRPSDRPQFAQPVEAKP